MMYYKRHMEGFHYAMFTWWPKPRRSVVGMLNRCEPHAFTKLLRLVNTAVNCRTCARGQFWWGVQQFFVQNFKGTHKKQPPFPKICLFVKNIIVKKNTFKENKSQGKENSRLEVNKTHLTMSIPLIYHWFCFDLHQKRHTVFKHRNLLARVVALKIIWSWHLENTLPSNLNFYCTCADVFDLFVRLVWLLSLYESSFINSP